MYNVIGSCSLCGGPVAVPRVWMGLYAPTPACQSCGATMKSAHGPVIDMERHDADYLRSGFGFLWK